MASKAVTASAPLRIGPDCCALTFSFCENPFALERVSKSFKAALQLCYKQWLDAYRNNPSVSRFVPVIPAAPTPQQTRQIVKTTHKLIARAARPLSPVLRPYATTIHPNILIPMASFVEKVNLDRGTRGLLRGVMNNVSQHCHVADQIRGGSGLKALVIRNSLIGCEGDDQIGIYRLEARSLTTFPAEIYNHTGVEDLYLARSRLGIAPPDFRRFPQLRSLNLGQNGLDNVPPTIFGHPQLKSLYLFENRIQRIPNDLASLVNLRNLNLSSNGISVLPKSIGSLVNLEMLWLEDNYIRDITPLCTCAKLTTLWMPHNPISHIPDTFAALTHLDTLHLGHNGLTSISPPLLALPHLLALFLDGNFISTIPPGISALQRLETLVLDDNDLTTLTLELASLPRLNALCIEGNQISCIPNALDAFCYGIRDLKLERNPLPTLPPLLWYRFTIVPRLRRVFCFWRREDE